MFILTLLTSTRVDLIRILFLLQIRNMEMVFLFKECCFILGDYWTELSICIQITKEKSRIMLLRKRITENVLLLSLVIIIKFFRYDSMNKY